MKTYLMTNSELRIAIMNTAEQIGSIGNKPETMQILRDHLIKLQTIEGLRASECFIKDSTCAQPT